jgi:hypothetical protein
MDLDSVLSNINSVLALSSDGTDADRRHIAHNAPERDLGFTCNATLIDRIEVMSNRPPPAWRRPHRCPNEFVGVQGTGDHIPDSSLPKHPVENGRFCGTHLSP